MFGLLMEAGSDAGSFSLFLVFYVVQQKSFFIENATRGNREKHTEGFYIFHGLSIDAYGMFKNNQQTPIIIHKN